jgi:hypothetical protein
MFEERDLDVLMCLDVNLFLLFLANCRICVYCVFMCVYVCVYDGVYDGVYVL